MLKYKLVLAGTKNVGKSSLIARFCDNVFNENMLSTIGVAFKKKKITLEDNLAIEVNIWDFAGEEKYRQLFPAYANGATAALILYNTTDRKTLDDIENWVRIIDDNNDDPVIKVLIGTKIDLIDQRVVSIAEAKKAAHTAQTTLDVIETSSKTGENVNEAFINTARIIVKQKMQKCKGCAEYYDINLKYCYHCGDKSSR